MALLEAGLSRKVYIKMGGKSMAGMGATVTSGGQMLCSQQWLRWLPTGKFREQHTNVKFLVC